MLGIPYLKCVRTHTHTQPSHAHTHSHHMRAHTHTHTHTHTHSHHMHTHTATTHTAITRTHTLTRVHWDMTCCLTGGLGQSWMVFHALVDAQASFWSSVCVRACSMWHSYSGKLGTHTLSGRGYSVPVVKQRGEGRGDWSGGEGRQNEDRESL